MEINSDELNHVFNKCINEQLINIISTICEGENLNYVEIVEKYGLANTSINRDFKPKKRELKFLYHMIVVMLLLLKVNNVEDLKIIQIFVEDIKLKEHMEQFMINLLQIIK